MYRTPPYTRPPIRAHELPRTRAFYPPFHARTRTHRHTQALALRTHGRIRTTHTRTLTRAYEVLYLTNTPTHLNSSDLFRSGSGWLRHHGTTVTETKVHAMSYLMSLLRFTRTASVMDHRAAYGVMKPRAQATRTARSEHAAKRSGMR